MNRARTTIALALLAFVAPASRARPDEPKGLFDRSNLVAWCIVPFDSRHRGPEDRAALLDRLGLKRLAYDWRAEHVPTFDAELETLARHKIALSAFWVAPGELNRESRRVLDVLKRHQVNTELWVLLDMGAETKVDAAEQARRVESAASKLGPLAAEAGAQGCSLALYNHGGWFGEPENQLAIIEHMKARKIENVGIVYNLHHGHAHLDRLAGLLKATMPYLRAVNLNGMDADGEAIGRKILPLGQGARDLEVLRTIRDSGYRGPIGILGHTMDDAEERLRDNLDGLDWLVAQLDGQPPGPRPKPRTPVAPRPDADKTAAAELARDALSAGDARRGADVFSSPKYACLSCHKVGDQGGNLGPSLDEIGHCDDAAGIAASILRPNAQVKPGYASLAIATADGRVLRSYKEGETADTLTLRDPASGVRETLRRADVAEVKEVGSLMPEGLAESMSPAERRDLVKFLSGLGGSGDGSKHLSHAHGPATFAFDRAPLDPRSWPGWRLPVNRDRVYDYYAKEAEHFAKIGPDRPSLLPQFPGLDGGSMGHWGNQSDPTWTDGRWNAATLGSVMSGVFRGGGVTVPKGVCVRLGDRGELSACFNPETLTYDALWSGGFVDFAPTRHGFVDGIRMVGTAQPRPGGAKPGKPFLYRGFYRSGDRVVFAYRLGDVEMLDAPWVEDGKFVRIVAPADVHPLSQFTRGGKARWPEVIATKATLGVGRPYAVDTIEPPFENPWKSPLFFGDHDFLPDGTALICTMQGDVWRVEGLDETLANVRWRRVAAGLHHALGLVVAEGVPYVLGRDQITRLRDLDGDGEYDFHECFSNVYTTSPAGHDFICGLQRDPEGRFYTASGNQGVLRIAADGGSVEVLATGFRNPDGIGLAPDGAVTVPSSEGEWTPTSMIAEVRPGGHYGYGGPRNGQVPDAPMVYLPRGLDNSSGGQAFVPDDRFGPLKGLGIHFSFGMGAHFLLLRDHVGGVAQAAVVPLPGEFRSGAHRGRFSPKDGQLYVSGLSGWGSYTPDDGSFQRVRYVGGEVRLPVSWRAHVNGVALRFANRLDPSIAGAVSSHFAQAWNYRYGPGYGSPELSTTHPGTPGHDVLEVRSAHLGADGKTLFLEIPALQPVGTLHLHMKIDSGEPVDIFATINRLDGPFEAIPGYRREPKTIAAAPILADLMTLKNPPVPNPWRWEKKGSRAIQVSAGPNLSFQPRELRAKAGEAIKLTFVNPDVVPHNWALVRPGTLAAVGDLANKLVADPSAVTRHYVPTSGDVVVYTDVVNPGEQGAIWFRVPEVAGRYPFLCTFPGHWMVMNGELIVEPK